MKFSKLTPLIGVAVFATIALAGCTVPGQGGATAQAVAKGSIKIGYSGATQQSPFYVALGDAAQAQAAARGEKYYSADANGDVTKQNNDVQDLITRGINVLIIDPVDPTGITPALAAAKAAGIKVVTVDRPVTTGAVSFVGRDNKAMGKLVGQQAVKSLGTAGGKIIEIQGDAGGAVAKDRGDGFAEGVASQSNISVVAGPYCNYVRSQAVTAMQNLLQANPDVKAVYAENDDMAMGALQVLQENNRTDVKVFGIDGLMQAVKSISTGDQYVATASNDPKTEGSLAVDTAITVAQGKSVPTFVDAGTGLVTKSNAGSLVGSATFAKAVK